MKILLTLIFYEIFISLLLNVLDDSYLNKKDNLVCGSGKKLFSEHFDHNV